MSLCFMVHFIFEKVQTFITFVYHPAYLQDLEAHGILGLLRKSNQLSKGKIGQSFGVQDIL